MHGKKIEHWIYQWSCCSQKSNMVFSRQQTALPLVTACNALEKNCEAQNFDITGASIDQTNPAHHMVLRRSRRKVKLQSQTGSIQETVEHQEDSSSVSMESGIKQGNPRFTKQKQPQGAYTMERDEEVQNMLNDGVRLGLGVIQERNVFAESIWETVNKEIEKYELGN
jgi:hypothetical protein